MTVAAFDGVNTVTQEWLFEFTQTVTVAAVTTTVTDYVQEHDFVYTIPANLFVHPDSGEGLTFA